MTRKAKLEKALAYAAFYEGRKLAPLHAVLLEAVEALERSKQVLDEIIHERYSDDLVMSEMVDNDPAYIEIRKQEEALAKIDKVLEGK